ncbi:Alpha/Beta hydrolase protein [Mycena pura]|uniref:Alpha/Beta hydrolase protein n=1 Tax=Mycena pura TaxID=153505 RepID=A0AAD6US62_9AGAR|nr:Alpha/Beta hydrolase protein [Mycena pura]
MFDVTLDTPTGVITFNYIIYHPQFADRELRRFNLVALDLRCHGRTVGPVGPGYDREVAARDVHQFMEALQIPQYHLFGMSMGGCIALQTAIFFPEAVQSIFVVSPLPLTEPPDVAEGRQEIFDCWVEGVRSGDSISSGAMGDSIMGALQLSVNGQPSRIFKAMLRRSIDIMPQQWGDIDRMDELHTVFVDFFTRREAYTASALQRIACPVKLVHCLDDIAYMPETTELVAARMRAAHVTVDVEYVPGAPHFGATTHPKEINEIFHRFMLMCCTSIPPPIPDCVESPFAEELAAALSMDSDSGSDSDNEDREFFI